MTVFTPKVWQCDRCHFETQPGPACPNGWTQITVALGTASRFDAPFTIRGSHDLCPGCTAMLFAWWKEARVRPDGGPHWEFVP